MSPRTLPRLFALPITRQLMRLNDNIEALMRHWGVRVPSDKAEKAVFDLSQYDEEVEALREFEEKQ